MGESKNLGGGINGNFGLSKRLVTYRRGVQTGERIFRYQPVRLYILDRGRHVFDLPLNLSARVAYFHALHGLGLGGVFAHDLCLTHKTEVDCYAALF